MRCASTAGRRRGQGAMEYLLLLAGVVFIVVIAVVVLRGGILQSVNRQIAGSTNTFFQLTSVCQALSQLVIHPNGTNATLTICQPVPPNATVVFLFSDPIVFNGSVDQPVNMSFFTDASGKNQIFLNVIAKNGTALNMSLPHCVTVGVNNQTLVQNLCGTTGSTTAPPPTPTPTTTFSSCGQQFTTLANYQLTANLTCSGYGVNFTSGASGSTLNCQGFTLISGGPAYTGYGIFLNSVSNFTVANCAATGYERGLYSNNSLNVTIQGSTFYNNTYGVFFNPTNQSTIQNNTHHSE